MGREFPLRDSDKDTFLKIAADIAKQAAAAGGYGSDVLVAIIEKTYKKLIELASSG